jgi:hypothetical protein
MSTMNLSHTRTWSDFSSLWSALKLAFAEWQRRAASRRLERTEASNVFWRESFEIERLKLNHRKAVMRKWMALQKAGALKI